MTPRVPEEGKIRTNSRGRGPPLGVRDLPRPSGPPTREEPTYRQGGSRATACSTGTGAGTGAGLPLEDSPTHRIQCGWLRRALQPRLAGQPLSVLTVDRELPRYTVSHLRRTRAEPACRINWIRRHDTFPSCRLRRKTRPVQLHCRQRRTLHSGAVSTRQGKARRSEDSRGQTREIQE